MRIIKALRKHTMKRLSQNDVIQITEWILGHHPIAAGDSLIEKFGAESTDIANIVVALEQKFEIRIPESALPALRTPRDFYDLIQHAR